MKILLIVPNIKSHDPMPCLSVAYLKGYIKSKSKHDVIIVDLAFHKKNWKKHVLKKISIEKPDIIGFSVISFNYPSAIEIADFIKQKFNIRIIFGGVHVILSPQEVMAWCDRCMLSCASIRPRRCSYETCLYWQNKRCDEHGLNS